LTMGGKRRSELSSLMGNTMRFSRFQTASRQRTVLARQLLPFAHQLKLARQLTLADTGPRDRPRMWSTGTKPCRIASSYLPARRLAAENRASGATGVSRLAALLRAHLLRHPAKLARMWSLEFAFHLASQLFHKLPHQSSITVD